MRRAGGPAVRATALVVLALSAAGAFAGEVEPGPDEEQPVHYVARRSFGVGYAAPEDTARIRLWVTENGGADWRPYGYDDDNGPPRSPVGFATDHDGAYGFCVVAEDRAGNRIDPSPGTPPQLVIVVDTTPPRVELLAPNDGFVGPARGAVVRWTASDEYIGEDSARVEYSADGGAGWVEVAAGRPSVGSFTWLMGKVEPAGARAFRFRVTARDRAGNSADAVSRADVMLDDEPPTAAATGQGDPAAARPEIVYEADDAGGAGVESVRLYVSADGGGTWKLAAVDDDGVPPVAWTPPRAGPYGLFAAATDRAGNKSPAPEPGTRPQAEIEVRRTIEVRLKTLHTGGYYRGGAEQTISWEAPAPAAVRLEYSADNGKTWNEIASGLGASGEFAWAVPKVDTKEALVRVAAESPSGASGSDRSRRPFVIDSTPPRAVVAFDAAAQDVPVPLAVEGPPPVVLPEEPASEPPVAGAVSAPPREIARAREHLDARRYEEAIQEVAAFLEREPGDAEASAILGIAHARATDRLGGTPGTRPEELLRRYGEAEAALRTALEADPTSNEARVWLGACLLGKAEVHHARLRRAGAAARAAAAAADAFEKALAAEPNTSDEYFYAALAQYILASDGPRRERPGAAGRASGLFERAVEGAAPQTAGRAHFYLAGLAEARGEDEAALGHWKKVIETLGEKSAFSAAARERIARQEGR